MPVIPGSKVTASCRHTRLHVLPCVTPVVVDVLQVVMDKKVNITHLGRLAGVPREQIYRWARGATPRLHDLEAVASVLGLEITARKAAPDA